MVTEIAEVGMQRTLHVVMFSPMLYEECVFRLRESLDPPRMSPFGGHLGTRRFCGHIDGKTLVMFVRKDYMDTTFTVFDAELLMRTDGTIVSGTFRVNRVGFWISFVVLISLSLFLTALSLCLISQFCESQGAFGNLLFGLIFFLSGVALPFLFSKAGVVLDSEANVFIKFLSETLNATPVDPNDPRWVQAQARS